MGELLKSCHPMHCGGAEPQNHPTLLAQGEVHNHFAIQLHAVEPAHLFRVEQAQAWNTPLLYLLVHHVKNVRMNCGMVNHRLLSLLGLLFWFLILNWSWGFFLWLLGRLLGRSFNYWLLCRLLSNWFLNLCRLLYMVLTRLVPALQGLTGNNFFLVTVHELHQDGVTVLRYQNYLLAIADILKYVAHFHYLQKVFQVFIRCCISPSDNIISHIIARRHPLYKKICCKFSNSSRLKSLMSFPGGII